MQRASVRVCVCLTLSRSVTREEPAVREAKFTSNVRYPLPQIPPTPTGDRAAELVARVAVKHDVVLRFAITITGKCQWHVGQIWAQHAFPFTPRFPHIPRTP